MTLISISITYTGIREKRYTVDTELCISQEHQISRERKVIFYGDSQIRTSSLHQDSNFFSLSKAYMKKLCTHKHIYQILPSKHPWALEIHEPKTGVGTYTEKPEIIGSSKIGGRLHRDGAYSGDYGINSLC